MQVDGDGLDRVAAALLDRLRDELAVPGLRYRRRPAELGGGRFSSVFAFEVEPAPPGWTGSFVLRLVGSSDQMRLEAALHEAASAATCAPRVALSDVDLGDTGVSGLVMERIPGRGYLRGVEPWHFALDLPKLAAAWPRRFPEVIHALARVDPHDVMQAFERHGVPDDAGRGRHLRAVSSTLGAEPGAAPVLEWLHEHRPAPPERVSLVHGDLWPGNVFFPNGQVRLIDWTRGGVDDPALDVGFAKVGFALMPEPFPPPPPARQLASLAGRSIAERISAHSDHLVGGAERVRYYEALRCAVELADLLVDRSNGVQPGWEHGVPALVRHLEGITGLSITFR